MESKFEAGLREDTSCRFESLARGGQADGNLYPGLRKRSRNKFSVMPR
jgi:hypothetical protein